MAIEEVKSDGAMEEARKAPILEELLKASLADDEQMQADRDQVEQIMCIEKEELCRTQTQKRS